MLLRRDRKLGICRDYAKLTACLLSNIYKDVEIYFLHSAGHVATGMKIENELYILDQHPPLLRISQWIRREHGSVDPSKIFFLYKKAHKLCNNRLQSVKVDSLMPKGDPKLLQSLQELSQKMSQILNIQARETGDSKSEVFSVDLPKWKAGAILFEMNDEMVNYSLSHALKSKILNELIDLSKIIEIEVEKENEDLIFKITSVRTNVPTSKIDIKL